MQPEWWRHRHDIVFLRMSTGVAYKVACEQLARVCYTYETTPNRKSIARPPDRDSDAIWMPPHHQDSIVISQTLVRSVINKEVLESKTISGERSLENQKSTN